VGFAQLPVRIIGGLPSVSPVLLVFYLSQSSQYSFPVSFKLTLILHSSPLCWSLLPAERPLKRYTPFLRADLRPKSPSLHWHSVSFCVESSFHAVFLFARALWISPNFRSPPFQLFSPNPYQDRSCRPLLYFLLLDNGITTVISRNRSRLSHVYFFPSLVPSFPHLPMYSQYSRAFHPWCL